MNGDDIRTAERAVYVKRGLRQASTRELLRELFRRLGGNGHDDW